MGKHRTDPFAIDLDFHGVDSQSADSPTTLVGIRYTSGGEAIVPDDDTETAYIKDYLPNLLRKWLHYVRALNNGEDRIFEFSEYSDLQFRLRLLGDHIELTVTKRHREESYGTYEIDLEQFAGELVDATIRYREWLLNQNPDLASADAVQELQELSGSVAEEVTTPDDETDA